MKTIKLIGVLLLGATLLQACKKGKDDPFLSLKSRDARITGVWNMVGADFTETGTYTDQGTTVTDVYTTVYSDGVLTETYNGANPISTAFSWTLDIMKGGNYKETTVWDGDTEEDEREWWWKSNDKKKSILVIGGAEYTIDRLTNKELVLSIFEQEIDTWDTGSDQEVYTGTLTFEKQK